MYKRGIFFFFYCLTEIYMYIDFPIGFDSKSVSVTGLEEYWPYRFKVIAATGKGNSTSDFSRTFRTKSGRKWHVRETYLYMHTLH